MKHSGFIQVRVENCDSKKQVIDELKKIIPNLIPEEKRIFNRRNIK